MRRCEKESNDEARIPKWIDSWIGSGCVDWLFRQSYLGMAVPGRSHWSCAGGVRDMAAKVFPVARPEWVSLKETDPLRVSASSDSLADRGLRGVPETRCFSRVAGCRQTSSR